KPFATWGALGALNSQSQRFAPFSLNYYLETTWLGLKRNRHSETTRLANGFCHYFLHCFKLTWLVEGHFQFTFGSFIIVMLELVAHIFFFLLFDNVSRVFN